MKFYRKRQIKKKIKKKNTQIDHLKVYILIILRLIKVQFLKNQYCEKMAKGNMKIGIQLKRKNQICLIIVLNLNFQKNNNELLLKEVLENEN